MSIEYKSNIKDVLARTLSVPEMHAKLLKGMNRGGAQFTGWIQETQLSGRPGLNVGGNRLRASFTYKTQDSPTNITTTMGTNVFYAIVHQKGKTIYPKTAKALCFSITSGYRLGYFSKRAKRQISREKVSTNIVFAKHVTIPKRLHIPEEFQRVGTKMFKEEILGALAIK